MGHSCSRHARNPLTQQLPATHHRGWSRVKIPRPCSVMISSSSVPLSQQAFETLTKCYPLVNFARFSIILIPKHTSIPKATRLRGVTTPLRVCALNFLYTRPLNVKRENFTPIMIKGMYDYSHSNSTLNVKGYKNSQGNRGFWEKKITP